MYIGSTNIYLNVPAYDTKAPASWITSEKYDNCENFYQHMAVKQSKRNFFHKKNDSTKIN